MKALVLFLAAQALAVAASTPTVDREFAAMDANHDGRLTPTEHAAGAKAMFGKMDTNRDGKVTSAEMTAAHTVITGQPAKPSDMAATDKIKALDDKRDGILSAEEHATGAARMFAKMDADHDGTLSKDEMAAGHAAMLRK